MPVRRAFPAPELDILFCARVQTAVRYVAEACITVGVRTSSTGKTLPDPLRMLALVAASDT